MKEYPIMAESHAKKDFYASTEGKLGKLNMQTENIKQDGDCYLM